MKTSDAVAHFGDRAAIARTLGISRQAVHKWGTVVPLRSALLLEQASAGKLRAEMPKLPQAK
jgi:DNA-binding transcriptional regulator YdaS (Cro superfamily)